MAVEMLSYNQLGERLGCSPEAARALVKRLTIAAPSF
jgi:DNA-binding Lrp family transcriptional regulator